MAIEIKNLPLEEIRQKIDGIYEEKKSHPENSLDDSTVNFVKNVISTREIKEMLSNMKDKDFINHLSYTGLAKAEEAARILSENLTNLKKQVELDDFLSKGYNLDIDGLKEQYKKKKLHKKHPNLNFDRIKELYLKPPRRLYTYYSDKLYMTIDPFVFRKYQIAVIQMIFNHMDFVVCNIGDEGAGKSCKCSQDMYLLWWYMKEIGLIDYEFNIKETFANTLRNFSELEDKYYGVPFRIIGLDEGNELNRQDWKEDDVKLFWQRLRRERHEQRIKFINIPVLGEMIINIVLSRINFIFDMKNKNLPKTGTLAKGQYDFYIIPRGHAIYSPEQNKELTKEGIKNKLYHNLKDKEYLKGLPKELRIKKCKCNGVWGFKESDYIKELKETNRNYTIKKGLNFTMTELYCFYKANITFRQLEVATTDIIYPSLRKMLYRIKGFWNNNIELLTKYDYMFSMKAKKLDKEEVQPGIIKTRRGR